MKSKEHKKIAIVDVGEEDFALNVARMEEFLSKEVDVVIVTPQEFKQANPVIVIDTLSDTLIEKRKQELEQIQLVETISQPIYKGEFGTEQKKRRKHNNATNQYVDVSKKKRKKQQSKFSRKQNRRK